MKPLVKAQLNNMVNLIIQKSEFCPHNGLLNGKMGLCVFLYHYARFTNDQTISALAEDLVNSVYDQIAKTRLHGLENGITGIAWGLHHLAVNNFVEADLDDVLHDADKIYTNNVEQSGGFLNDEWFGIGLYVLLRLKSNNIEKWMATIQILIKHLRRQLLLSRFMDFSIKIYRSKTLASMLLVFTEIYKMGICRQEIESIFSEINQSIIFSHKEEKNMLDKKLLEQIMLETEKIISAFYIPKELNIFPIEQMTMMELNSYYLNNLIFNKIQISDDLLTQKIHQIISDPHLIPHLLSLFRSDCMGLNTHITGLSWTFLQWLVTHDNFKN